VLGGLKDKEALKAYSLNHSFGAVFDNR